MLGGIRQWSGFLSPSPPLYTNCGICLSRSFYVAGLLALTRQQVESSSDGINLAALSLTSRPYGLERVKGNLFTDDAYRGTVKRTSTYTIQML